MSLLALAALALASAAEAPFRALSWDAALAAAEKEGKVVLVDVFTTWCGPCKRLDETTWRDEKVRAFLEQRTVPLKVDAEKERELAARFHVQGFPTIVLVKPDGAELGRLVGYYAPDAFLQRAGALLVGDDPLAKAKLALSGHEDDPRLHEELAAVHVARKEYEAALQQLLWCFDHGAEARPAYAAARGSTLLRKITDLAREYSPAADALRARRAAIAAGLLEGTVPASEAGLVPALDAVLGQGARSLELYDALVERGPRVLDAQNALAAQLLDQFLASRRYADLLAHEPDPPGAVERTIAAARKAEEALDSTSGPDSPKLAARRRAIRAPVERLARAYHEACLATARAEQADRIADLVLAWSASGALGAGLVDGAVRAGEPAAARRLAERWEPRLPEPERAALRAALERIPR